MDSFNPPPKNRSRMQNQDGRAWNEMVENDMRWRRGETRGEGRGRTHTHSLASSFLSLPLPSSLSLSTRPVLYQKMGDQSLRRDGRRGGEGECLLSTPTSPLPSQIHTEGNFTLKHLVSLYGSLKSPRLKDDNDKHGEMKEDESRGGGGRGRGQSRV